MFSFVDRRREEGEEEEEEEKKGETTEIQKRLAAKPVSLGARSVTTRCPLGARTVPATVPAREPSSEDQIRKREVAAGPHQGRNALFF